MTTQQTIDHPLSEQTIIKHKYEYNGFKYLNDIGHPCEYRVVDKDGIEIEMVKYYKGRRLAVYGKA